MLDMVLQVAPTEVSVLLEGESGSGKELTARAIHLASRRRGKPFEAVNCGSLAETLLESELFGHERGSFTGAVSRRLGLFERADQGTLFLDEVGEMSLNMQVRLLRVIETGEFLRVGGTEKIRTDVRLIAATNRELESAVEKGEFRKDLYYRLKVVQIRIPTLRSRTSDIPILANYFIERSKRKHGKEIRGIDKEGMELLVSYPWPGNVRELANMIDNLVVLSKDVTIRAREIEKRLQGRLEGRTFTDLPVPIEKTRDEMERELIINSLLSINNDVKEILRHIRGGGMRVAGRWGSYVEVEEAVPEAPKELLPFDPPLCQTDSYGRQVGFECRGITQATEPLSGFHENVLDEVFYLVGSTEKSKAHLREIRPVKSKGAFEVWPIVINRRSLGRLFDES